MEPSENLAASANEDRRYHLLVDTITDYAIYMLDPLAGAWSFSWSTMTNWSS